MNTVRALISRNTFAVTVLAAALFVGTTYIAPRLAIRSYLMDQGESFVIMNFLVMNDDAKGYMGRAREIYDGHFPPTDLFGDPGVPMPFNPLPPLLWAPFVFLFRGNMDAAYLFSQFVFSAVLFGVFYGLARVTVRDRVWALFFGFMGMLTPLARFLSESLLSADRFLNNVIKNFYPLVRTPLDRGFLSRMDDPLLTLPIYLTAVAALLLFWERPTRTRAIGAGIAVGLLFYTYWHYWMYLAIVVGLMAGYAFLTRQGNSERFRMTGWLLAALGFAAVPYVINYVRFMHLDAAAGWILRLAPDYGHYLRTTGVLGDYLLYMFFALAVVAVLLRRERERAALYLLFILAMFIGWNVQVATGFMLATGHWRVTYSPILLLIGFHLGYELLRRYDRKIIYGVLAVLMVLLAAKKTMNVYAFIHPDERVFANPSVASRPQSYALDRGMVDSWHWIDTHLSGEPRIISPAFMTNLHLVIYTSARPYLPVPLNTILKASEIEERFLTAAKLFGVSRERLGEIIHVREANCPTIVRQFNLADQKCHSLEYYNVRTGVPAYHEGLVDKNYRDNFGAVDREVLPRGLPQAKVDELLARYDRMAPDWRDVVAEYVYYGPLERVLTGGTDFSHDQRLERIFQNGTVEIYRIQQ